VAVALAAIGALVGSFVFLAIGLEMLGAIVVGFALWNRVGGRKRRAG
jgi:hypothetical protein